MTTIMAQLDCLGREDDDAKVWVGYIPSLNLYTQATTEERLEQALKSAATMYLAECHRRSLLDKILARYGFSQVHGETQELMDQAQKEKRQFIAVIADALSEKFDRKIKVEVPLFQTVAA